jgi:hypothetical protein
MRVSGGNSPEVVKIETLVLRGGLGHLFDQQGGLLAHFPLLPLVVAGATLLLGRERRELQLTLGYSLPAFLLVGSFFNWSGSWGVPCRFLIFLVPLQALALAEIAARVRARPRALLLLFPFLLPWTLVTGTYLAHPALLLSLEGPGVNLASLYVYLFQTWGIDLLTFFPRFLATPGLRDHALALGLLALLLTSARFVHLALSERPAWRWGLAALLCLGLQLRESPSPRIRAGPTSTRTTSTATRTCT